jgi:hypothetical protein
MLTSALKAVNDIERLILQTLDGMEVRIRANKEGHIVVDVYREGHLLAHQSCSSMASAVELTFGAEAIRRLLVSAQPSTKEQS